jgi:RimJ/RimL family protein N-acetyltransferase
VASQSPSLRLRRAEPADVGFLLELANDAEVAPFLGSLTARDEDTWLASVERSAREPRAYGRFVVEQEGQPVGGLAFEATKPHHGIAELFGIMVSSEARGRGVGEAAVRRLVRELLGELGYHRVELECYGYNERAIRLFERAGFVREGVKRQAYRRQGEWVDSVLFGLVAEDLDEL